MTREKYIAVTPIVWTQVIKVDDRDNDPISYWQSGHGWWGLIGDWPSIMRVVSNAMFTVYIGTSGMVGTPNVVLTVWCLVIFGTLTRSRLTCVNLWLNAEPNVWTEKEPPHRRKNFREGHMNNFGVKSLTDVQCLLTIPVPMQFYHSSTNTKNDISKNWFYSRIRFFVCLFVFGMDNIICSFLVTLPRTCDLCDPATPRVKVGLSSHVHRPLRSFCYRTICIDEAPSLLYRFAQGNGWHDNLR